MSGNFPFDFLMGDRLPSSWYRYFSFCRRTLETVLHFSQHSFRYTALTTVPSLYAKHC